MDEARFGESGDSGTAAAPITLALVLNDKDVRIPPG